MAPPIRSARGQAPSLKGAIQVDEWRGRPRIRAWPRPRKRRKSPGQADREAWFRQAQWLSRYITSEQRVTAEKATAGTPLLPRDIITMAMAGRLFELILPDGKKVYSMAIRQDISEALDVLGQAPGSILYRDTDYWRFLAPTKNGLQALFTTGGTALEWRGVATLQGTYKTRLILTSSISAAEDATVHWQEAVFDEAGLWKLANPTILKAPADGVLKVSFSGRMTTNPSGGWGAVIANPDRTIFYSGQGQGNSIWSQVFVDWTRVTEGQEFIAYCSTSTSYNLSDDSTNLVAEFIPN